MKNMEEKWRAVLSDENAADQSQISFDAEKIWAVVSEKTKKRKTLLVPWMSHAAAILIGVLLTVSFFMLDKKQPEAITQIREQNDFSHAKKDTVFIATTVVEKDTIVQRQKEATPVKAIVNTIAEERIIPVEKDKAEQPEPIELPIQVAQTEAKTTKTIHLDDIESNTERASRTTAIEQLLASKLSTPSSSFSPSPLSFFKSLSN